MDEYSVRLYAAAIAYRTIFSVIAFVSTLALVAYSLGVEPGSIRGRTGTGDFVPGLGEDLEQVAFERAASTLELGSATVITAGLIGFVIGLYTLAGGFAALCEVLDRVHGTHRYASMTRRYLRGAGVAMVFLLFASVAIAVLVISTSLGDLIFEGLGLTRIAGLLRIVLNIIIPAICLLLTFGFLLRFGSHARPPWSQVLPGAAVGASVWGLLLVGFIGYSALFQPFKAYGALATSIGVLLFGYLQAYILILTALLRRDIAWLFALLPGVHTAADGTALAITIRGRTFPPGAMLHHREDAPSTDDR